MEIKKSQQRLLSLDILRGLDLFLLVFFQPVLVAFGSKLNLPLMNEILYQFKHEVWAGFRLWDLVMPLFLFMTGIAMPFSFVKYKNETNKMLIYRKIVKRFLLLFLLGMVVQGNLLALDLQNLRLYSNTLQAIAAGYLVASIILLNFSRRGQIIAAAVLMLLYWIPMSFGGDFSTEGNFAIKVDKLILGRFMDGVYWNSDGTWSFSTSYFYTWIISSLNFGVTVLLGAFAGQILMRDNDKLRNVKLLLVIGTSCIATSLLWSFQMPIIKPIWSCSMVLFSGGLCFILIAVFYYIIDYKNYTRGFMWLRFYGMNSIVAYVLGEVVSFRSIIDSVSYGLEQFLKSYYTVWLTFGNYLVIFFILRLLFKRGIFVKI